MKKCFILAPCITLMACTTGTGILPAGPDTYTISEQFAPVLGGGDHAQQDALTKANAFCAEKGRQFMPLNMGQSGPTTTRYTGPNGYTTTFKCLLPNDPALANFQLQPVPDVIIEQRNR
jgi:hypothetical protein